MSIRFAAAGGSECNTVARILTPIEPGLPANDIEPGISRDALLRSALGHFARHGMAAADKARANAERAFFEGDRDQYRHWLAVCRLLDRRMAEAIKARHIPKGK